MTSSLPLVALPLLYVAAYGSGLALFRRARLAPAEKLTAAVGASILFLYLTSFAVFLFGLPPWTNLLITAACAALTLSNLTGWREILSDRMAVACLGAFAFIVFWALLLLLLIRNYSGGGWSGDWLEHYQRALFFLDRPSYDRQFIDFYWLPARPPLMNLVSAYFLAHVGRDFPVYQLVTLLLNATVVFPLCLLAARFSRVRLLPMTVLVAFVALNPMFVENLTYGWTRPLANFYVLAALYAYLTARETGDAGRYALGWIAMAAAVLTHYSAAPYFVFLGLHFAIVVVARSEIRLARAFAIAFAVTLLLSSWFAWSLSVYGAEITFASNTTMTSSRATGAADQLEIFLRNAWSTLVPHPLRLSMSGWMEQESRWGYAKDWFFLIYQTNLPLALGSAGGVLLAFEASRRRISLRFWAPMALVVFALGVATTTTVEEYGTAHVCLQPLVLLGICILAAGFATWPAWVRATALCGLVVDALLGIGLLMWAQHQIPVGDETVSRAWSLATYLNWNAKVQSGVSVLGDVPGPGGALAVGFVALLCTGALLKSAGSTVAAASDRSLTAGSQHPAGARSGRFTPASAAGDPTSDRDAR